MLVSLVWVPRGSAKSVPVKTDLDDEEVKAALGRQRLSAREEKGTQNEEMEDVEETKSKGKEKEKETEKNNEMDRDIDKIYNLDDYDEEGGGILGLTELPMFVSNEEDPYLTIKEDDEEELEDITIRPTDGLLIAATTDTDISHLALHIYEENESNAYIHHDVMLASYPLCLAWMDTNPKNQNAKGNYVAVGTFDPAIEIWDMDVVDPIEPAATLGGMAAPPKPSKGKKKKKRPPPASRPLPGSHASAVLALGWNRYHKNVLASGGADATAKLWDVTTQKCLHTYTHHKDKIQSVEWHRAESNVLLTASYDKSVTIFDVASPSSIATWPLTADVECVRWNPHSPKLFMASTEDGNVTCYSIDMPGKVVFSFHAHDKAVSSLALNPALANYMATVSLDKSLKLWDITGDKPSCLDAKSLDHLGKLFCCSFYDDSPLVLAVGGKKGLKIIDTAHIDAVKEHFAK